MTAAARARGTRAERLVVDWLAAHGHPGAERAPRWGNRDRGDVTGVPGVTIEIKDVAAFDPAGALDEAVREAGHCGHGWVPVVVRRRKGKTDPGDWYAVLRLADLNALLRAAGFGDAPGTEDAERVFGGGA